MTSQTNRGSKGENKRQRRDDWGLELRVVLGYMRNVCTIDKGWYNKITPRYVATRSKEGMLLGGRVLVLGKLVLVLG